MKLSIVLCTLVIISQTIFAGPEPETQKVSLQKAFIPIGFDSNDRTQVTFAGVFPDSCHQVGPYDVKVDSENQEIRVTQEAYVYGGPCLDILVPFDVTLTMGILEAGSYTLIDGISEKVIGKLPVAKATTEGPGPDDLPYGPVSTAFVERNFSTGGLDLVLRGEFSARCLRMKKIDILYQDDVVVVLPIVEKTNVRDCTGPSYRFEKRTPLKELEDKAYLFHIRAMNGKALNFLFSGLPNS